MGATATFGVLVGLLLCQFLLAALVTGILFLTARKSGLTTSVLILTLSIVILAQDMPSILVAYPFILILSMVLKRLQNKQSGSW